MAHKENNKSKNALWNGLQYNKYFIERADGHHLTALEDHSS